MERLIWHIIDELTPQFRVHIIGPTGCGEYAPTGATVTEVAPRPLPRFLLMSLVRVLSQALSKKPVLVLAGSGLTAPPAWLASRCARCQAWAYLHGLDIDPGVIGYIGLWVPIIRRCDRFLVNSRFTSQLAAQAGIPRERTDILNPGVDIPSQSETQLRGKAASRARLELPANSQVILYVGRITERKGLRPLVTDILPRLVDNDPEMTLAIVGADANDAINSNTTTRASLTEEINRLGLNNNVCWLGSVSDDGLSDSYISADVVVFPLQYKSHDYEGFGMVALEAAAHGRPTVAFEVGGVADAIADPATGRLVPPGDTHAFVDAVLSELAKDPTTGNASCRAFADERSWAVFGRKLRRIVSDQLRSNS